MSESLKPCPFCGEAAEIEYGGLFCWPRCSNLGGCGAVFSLKSYDNVPAAIAFWNRRASPASPAIVEAERRVIEVFSGKCLGCGGEFQPHHGVCNYTEAERSALAALAALRSKQDAPATGRCARCNHHQSDHHTKHSTPLMPWPCNYEWSDGGGRCPCNKWEPAAQPSTEEKK